MTTMTERYSRPDVVHLAHPWDNCGGYACGGEGSNAKDESLVTCRECLEHIERRRQLRRESAEFDAQWYREMDDWERVAAWIRLNERIQELMAERQSSERRN